MGQRVDSNTRAVRGVSLYPDVVPQCPFAGTECTKLKGKESKHPVCSLQVGEDVFIVCSNRLIPAQSRNVNSEHLDMLSDVASVIFPNENESNIGYLRQKGISIDSSKVQLDYVLCLENPSKIGPSKVILEVQGGGETSNTGNMTRLINEWLANPEKTNNELYSEMSGIGLIPNNAWKRQVWQLILKGQLANHFDGGVALAMGSKLYDYVVSKGVSEGTSWFPEWEVCLIEMCTKFIQGESNTIKFTPGRSTFYTYQDFIESMNKNVEGGENPFEGEFMTFSGRKFTINSH